MVSAAFVMDTPVRSVEGQVRKRRLNNIETETSVEDQVRKRKLNNVEIETYDRLVLKAILPILFMSNCSVHRIDTLCGVAIRLYSCRASCSHNLRPETSVLLWRIPL